VAEEYKQYITLSPTSCKSICVIYDYNKRLDIRAISGCLYIYIYDFPQAKQNWLPASHAGFLPGLLFDSESGSDMSFRKTG
jgi:hypothetical protein